MVLTPRIVAEGIQHCIANARRYILAAKKLADGDMQTAYLLLMYASEEMGKVPLLATALYHTAPEHEWKKWLQRFKDHEEKFWFSKDLDDFAERRLGSNSNKTDETKAQAKLDVAYVWFDGAHFKLPKRVTAKGLNALREDCYNRLSFLVNTHVSVEADEKKIAAGYEKLKDMSDDEVKELGKKFSQNN